MKSTKILMTLSVSLMLAFVAGAVTPKPTSSPQSKPTAKPSPSEKASPADKSTPTSTTTPASRPTPSDLASPSDMPTPTAAGTPVNAVPPKPVLYLMTQEPYTTGGKNWIRYRYDVANKADYPAEMFAAAPGLPPCGSNTNSSRTWVHFYDSTGKRLYGFCALSKPADLGKIWFALEEGVLPPSYVYIELDDRQTNTKYKSNLADTTI